MRKEQLNIVTLSEVGIEDIELAGGKNASLGELRQHLVPLGVQVPDGFVITVNAFRVFMEADGLRAAIRERLATIDYDNGETLRRAGLQIRSMIRTIRFPPGLAEEIIEAYYALSDKYSQLTTDVAVRSSVTAAGLPGARFAGQENYLNVRGPVELINAVRDCFASLFTDRAISYRHHFQFDHFEVLLSVGVQKMVRSDLGASGVAFSPHRESGLSDAVIINGSYGLGGMAAEDAVFPDEFIVCKPALKDGNVVIEKKLGSKDKQLVYGDTPDERVRIIPTEKSVRRQFCLDDSQVTQLAGWVCRIEEHYRRLRGQWCPMDVEWALDGVTGELFIVQAVSAEH